MHWEGWTTDNKHFKSSQGPHSSMYATFQRQCPVLHGHLDHLLMTGKDAAGQCRGQDLTVPGFLCCPCPLESSVGKKSTCQVSGEVL